MTVWFLLFAVSVFGQGHGVNLLWKASVDNGATYSIYRATGTCPGTGVPSSATVIKTGITGLAYSDTAVVPGPYCYYATAVLNSVESVPSNTALAVVPVGPPSDLGVQGAVSENRPPKYPAQYQLDWGRTMASNGSSMRLMLR